MRPKSCLVDKGARITGEKNENAGPVGVCILMSSSNRRRDRRNERKGERETSRMRYALDEISTDAATSCRLQNCLNDDNAMLWQEVPRVSLLPLPELSVYGMLSIQMLIVVSRY